MDSAGMQKRALKMISRKMDRLPPEAKAAMERTEVNIVRYPDQVVIAIDAKGDADMERIKTILLYSILAPISQAITLLGVKTNVQSHTNR